MADFFDPTVKQLQPRRVAFTSKSTPEQLEREYMDPWAKFDEDGNLSIDPVEFWAECRRNGAMLIDRPGSKVAIYGGGFNVIVIATEDLDFGGFNVHYVEAGDIPGFVRRITEVGFECVAAYAELCASMPDDDGESSSPADSAA